MSSTLRGEGLTVGTPDPGSILLPVSGTAAVVSAAFGTPLESVQAPNEARALVNTAAPQIPASLAGVVDRRGRAWTACSRSTPCCGRKPGSSASPGRRAAGSQRRRAPSRAPRPRATPRRPRRHAAGLPGGGRPPPPAGPTPPPRWPRSSGWTSCSARAAPGSARRSPSWSSSSTSASDFAAFESCYGLSNPIRNVVVDGGPGGPPAGRGRGRARHRAGVLQRARRLPRRLRGAERRRCRRPSTCSTASPATTRAQVVTTQLGQLRGRDHSPRPPDREHDLLAHGRAGTDHDRGLGRLGLGGLLPGQRVPAVLGVDDPGSQPDVVSAGGTTLVSASASSPGRVERLPIRLPAGPPGAGGGGYSRCGPRPGPTAARRVPGGSTNPCGSGAGAGCRSVPDISYPSDPSARVGGRLLRRIVGRLRRHQRGRADQCRALRRHQPGLLRPPRPGRAGALRGRHRRATSPTSSRGTTTSPTPNGGDFTAGPGYDAASGLGTPIDQNLVHRAAGRRRVPVGGVGEPEHGPDQRRRRHHDLGRRLRQRHLGHVRLGRHRPDRLRSPRPPSR